jgi:hypothetical protein
MKTLYKKLCILLALFTSHDLLLAQCAGMQTGGSSVNMFTCIRNSQSVIAANKALNTIVFIHRNDATTFGGNSGNLRFDYSVNGGTNYTINQGYLNPALTAIARYPNVAIYNPASNTNTTNAYVAYMAPTFTGSTTWNGEVTGVSKLNVTGVTESYNSGGIGSSWQASSLTNGAPGVFWAIDEQNSGTGFYIYKGVWNSGSNDINWSINYSINPTFYYIPSFIELDMNIAFDPTGNIGYACFAGHVNPGPAPQAMYPILYKTTDGGNTWTGPITVDLTQFSCITSNTVSPYVPSMNQGSDLVVDVNGNPHIVTTLGMASGYTFNYNQWHHMYDITMKNGLWVAYDLGNVNGASYLFTSSGGNITAFQNAQASRSADGTRVFFMWTDNSSYSLGSPNNTPNLFGKACNVTNGSWTPTKDFTSCNSTANGKVIFPHSAAEALEPSSSSYYVPSVYGDAATPYDISTAVNFKLLDNITFATSEFSLSVPAATVTIQQAPLAVICPGSSLTLNITGTAAQALWNTGATTPTLSITSGTATSYSVVAQVGCNVGTATIAVATLSLNPVPPSTPLCPGNSGTFTAAGNALGYTWTPGSITGSNVILNPTTSPVTLTAMGSNSCTTSFTVGVNLLPQPTITVAGSNTICANSVLSQTANGGATYVWNNNATGATFTDTPLTNTCYTVTGTAANTCTNVAAICVTVKPSPTVNIAATPTVVCPGKPVSLMASGAPSFSWDNTPSPPNIIVNPTITTIYMATGAGTNLCQTSKTISILVYATPIVTVTQARPIFCKGEKIKLTASGANSYTWTNAGVISSSVQVNPTVTTTYSIDVVSAEGCTNTETYQLVVSPCIGISEAALDNVSMIVYPNPANGTFIIKTETDLSFKILNDLGQIIRTGLLSGNSQREQSVSDLPAGIYFIEATNGQAYIKQKVVVTR